MNSTHSEGGTRHGCAIYRDDSIEVVVSRDGLPKAWHLVPAPFVSDEDRAARFLRARRSLWLQGLFIEHERMIRNTAFDKRGEKTTLKLTVRPCKDRDEALVVMGKIRDIVGEHREAAEAAR